jgi:hypothetical protein
VAFGNGQLTRTLSLWGSPTSPCSPQKNLLVGSKRLRSRLANQRCTGEWQYMEFLHHLNRHARLGPSTDMQEEWMLRNENKALIAQERRKKTSPSPPLRCQTTGRHRYRIRGQHKLVAALALDLRDRCTSGPNDSFPSRSRRRSTEQLTFLP